MIDLQNMILPLLTALIGFLGKSWVDEHNRKKDNFNQISNNGYQKLFERKIDTYNELASIGFQSSKFDTAYSGAVESADINENTKKTLIHKHYIKIYESYLKFEKTIQNDFLILSPELGSAYLDWQSFIYHESKELLQGSYQIHACGIDDAFELLKREYRITERESDFHSKISETDKHSYELKALIIGELIELNSDRFNCLIALIKHDILKINKRINNFDL